MAQYISKDALKKKIKQLQSCTMDINMDFFSEEAQGEYKALSTIDYFINTLEMKEVDLIIHTVIAECCDWLAMHTNLSHNEIEDCRNLMLTVKEEQLKAQKGE